MTEVADNTVVDGRYRIVRRIGSGGMADVYCAEDVHLGREVALKVLHRRFAQDQEFVERFRREASSAAGLQHPNVVGVFDRGEHDGTYYIAMEHLPGRTLKDVVTEQAPLPQELVIDLGLQILAAAGFAHRNNVIHRDFKPHNVIVDENWHAKVTDFGIARAGASEMTETGSIMGTAQYLSPEQAQGHSVGATADIYSIGVMLYEMLSGRLPFEGDSAVSVALKHLSEPPRPISQLRPDVNPALESVVMAALAKDPAHRWQTAEDFAEGLRAALAHVQAGVGTDTAEFAPVAAPVAANGDSPPDAPREPEEHRRRWPWIALGLLALALVALLAFLAIDGLLAPEKKEVPNVVGKQLIEARQQLERSGFDVQTERVRSQVEFDQVLDQDPNPGDEAEEGSTVTLEVSRGPGNVLVPTVTGRPREQALNELEKAGLKVSVEERPSEDIREGYAIRTTPDAGASVVKGSRITLLVSSGPEQVAVPDVVGLSRESAEDSLRAEGLRVVVQEEASDTRAGDVISQDPAANTEVDAGSRITITVSTGPEQVGVPDVIGLTAADARRALKDVGLKAEERSAAVSDENQDGLVTDQSPDGGGEVDEGSTIVIFVGTFEADTLEAPDGTATP